MKTKVVTCLVILWGVFLFGQSALSADSASANNESAFRKSLPDAPDGFDWVLYRNCAFLKPHGWTQRSRPDVPEEKTVGSIAISPEDFSETKFFEHGFTVQVIANFKKLNKIEPSKGAAAIIQTAAKLRKPDENIMATAKQNERGALLVYRYRDAPAGETPIIVHKYFIADDVSDTLHIFIYESPVATWDDNWKQFGTPILQKIVVLPLLPESEWVR